MKKESEEIKKSKTRKTIVLAAIGILLLVCTIQVFLATKNLTTGKPQSKFETVATIEEKIVFEQPKLHIFGKLTYLNQFPDRVLVHHPYVIVVTPGDLNRTTTVYNTKTQKKVAQFSNTGLDYSDGDFLYSQNSYSFLNKKNLGVQCDQGLIKSKTEIYCITAKQDDPLDNKLISINPQTLERKDIYSSQNLLETISSINNVLYISEFNITTRQAYLTVGKNTIPIPTQANIIYAKGSKVYYATFKINERKQEAQYYEIETKNKELTVKLVEKGRIAF